MHSSPPLPVLAAVVLATLVRADAPAPGEGEPSAPAPEVATTWISPSRAVVDGVVRVFPTCEYHVRARPSAWGAAAYRWTASAGRFLIGDRRDAVWEAPGASGDVEIVVEAESSDGHLQRGVVRVRVEAPELEGMVRIPGGIRRIGDTWTDTTREGYVVTNQNRADKPAHDVSLPSFWIRRERVTNEEYATWLRAELDAGAIEVTDHAVLGWQRGALVPFFRFSWADVEHRIAHLPPLRRSIRFEDERFVIEPGHERHPVVDVTWAGADAFARAHGHRLPTNAEWEVAARGDDGRRFPWGDAPPTPRHANVNDFFPGRLFPVGTFSPLGDSPYGVREMIGGIFEWVDDWYDESYYADVTSGAPVASPRGPHWGKDKVIRGVPGGQGVNGAEFEQPPLSFRYAWFFEYAIGDGVATSATGFRTAADDVQVPENDRAADSAPVGARPTAAPSVPAAR